MPRAVASASSGGTIGSRVPPTTSVGTDSMRSHYEDEWQQWPELVENDPDAGPFELDGADQCVADRQ
jgi:hypothetical protein